MPPENILSVEDLAVSFDNAVVLERITFSLKTGEVLAIVGPNGAGKSVLFRALLDLLPYSGRISWQPNLKLSYVPQKLAIERPLPLTVREFLKLKSPSAKPQEILEALEAVGVKTGPTEEHHLEHHILNRRLGMLSGGEFQRVLIAWALIGRPDVLLFDEPTTGIDIGGEETIYKLLHRLHQQRNLTMLIISHDLNIVYKYANQVICLNRELVCQGAPNQVLNAGSLAKLYGEETSFYHHPHALHHDN